MIVNAHTRISQIIRENPEAIDAIASLAKPLEKLKNPLLRKVFASRVTVSQAASMGGCTLEAFRQALEKIGFQWEEQAIEQAKEESLPQWLTTLTSQDIVEMDVRPTLEQGQDPLKDILHAYEGLQFGQALCIINSFEPIPLIQLLGKKGAMSHTIKKSDGLYYTYFLKSDQQESSTAYDEDDAPAIIYCNLQKWEEMLALFPESKRKFVDVRHLEMPQPMHTILSILPSLAPGEALLVQHKRVPIYLLEELHDSSYRSYIYQESETEVWLLIVQTATHG